MRRNPQPNMCARHPIAIVGGGPAGALAAALLAAGGRDVHLFDEKLAWEKPCGGGLTHKALQQYPFLAEARSESNPVAHCELISPSGRRVRFHLRHPCAIFSRLALNGLLLERARRAGVGVHADVRDDARVDIHRERVTRIAGTAGDWQLVTPQREYRASYLILAAGARNSFRSQFLSPIFPSDLMVTAGYFIPGHGSRGNSSRGNRSLMQIQFLKGITGYIWVFPRTDHASAGIMARMGKTSTAELRRILERWLEEHWLEDCRNKDRRNQQNGFHLDGARFYSHILPSYRAQTFETLKVCGDGWTMIGDSAGLVDPITGEGLYYALRSAELCASALLAGRPDHYQALLEDEVLAELKLAARVSERFYGGQVFGDRVLERMVSLTAQSASFRELMSDLFAGIQGYRDLRSRLYRILPSVMAEGLAGTLRRPWRGSSNGAAPVMERQ
jgi:flavin-dependent dehydrogenase